MRKWTTAIGYFLATLFVVPCVCGGADAQPVTDTGSSICATVTLLEGVSTVALPSLSQRPVAAGEMLSAGSILQTGSNSKVELTFADKSVVRINEDSAIELAVDAGKAEKQAERFQVKLLKGEMWVTLLDQPEGISSMQVLVAGTLLAGNRSVFRAVLSQDGAAEMKVYSGYVTASGPFVFAREASRFLVQTAENDAMRDMEPWRYRIEPYRKLIVQASGKETKPFRFTARADISGWVRWNQARDADIR